MLIKTGPAYTKLDVVSKSTQKVLIGQCKTFGGISEPPGCSAKNKPIYISYYIGYMLKDRINK